MCIKKCIVEQFSLWFYEYNECYAHTYKSFAF